LDANAVT